MPPLLTFPRLRRLATEVPSHHRCHFPAHENFVYREPVAPTRIVLTGENRERLQWMPG